MIELLNVDKTVRTGGGRAPALSGASLSVGPETRLAVIGRKPAARALLDLMAGLVRPDSGDMARSGRISFPIGRGLPADPEATGAEVCRFHAALHGAPPARVEADCHAAGLGERLFEPWSSYSPAERLRLRTALAAALEFDIHLVGDGPPLRRGARFPAARMLERRLERGGLALVVSDPGHALIRLCDRVAVIAGGAVAEVGSLRDARRLLAHEP